MTGKAKHNGSHKIQKTWNQHSKIQKTIQMEGNFPKADVRNNQTNDIGWDSILSLTSKNKMWEKPASLLWKLGNSLSM